MHVTEKMPPFDLCNNHYQMQRSEQQKLCTSCLNFPPSQQGHGNKDRNSKPVDSK